MKVPATWETSFDFACHSAACAPPPAGRGGSLGGKLNKPSERINALYKDMKNREKRQAALAQTNRARANYGMKPISN